MSEKCLHIISFDIPYPPNYGGVIDVFYKLKHLHAKGIKIFFHCFEYPGRERSMEIEPFCERVYYYERLTGLKSALSLKPYIIKSRRSEKLIANLLKDNHPVLFEGLHSCFYLSDKRLTNRRKIYRESNIEHRYYFNLFKVERNIYKKLYFLIESLKLRLYQRVLRFADIMLTVSESDRDYLQAKFISISVIHIPSFHANEELKILQGRGDYALYHGNIEVPENAFSAAFLIKDVFSKVNVPLVIAGMNPPDYIHDLVEAYKDTVTLIPNPDDNKMFELIRHAQVNILVTFQATGLKLKLLNTLYNGRFNLVNSAMVEGTPLGDACIVADRAEALATEIDRLKELSFDTDSLKRRQEILMEHYSNTVNAERLISLVF